MVDGIHPGLARPIYHPSLPDPSENPAKHLSTKPQGRPVPIDIIDLSPNARKLLDQDLPHIDSTKKAGPPFGVDGIEHGLWRPDQAKGQPMPDPQGMPRGIPFGDPLGSLSQAEREKAESLLNEMGEILASVRPAQAKQLSQTEHKREDKILERMSEILSSTRPSQQSLEKAVSIQEKMTKILEDGAISPEEEKQLAELGEKLSETYGSPVTLGKEQQKELDGLQAELDELYGVKPLSDEDTDRLATIQNKLNELYSKAFALDAGQQTNTT